MKKSSWNARCMLDNAHPEERKRGNCYPKEGGSVTAYLAYQMFRQLVGGGGNRTGEKSPESLKAAAERRGVQARGGKRGKKECW